MSRRQLESVDLSEQWFGLSQFDGSQSGISLLAPILTLISFFSSNYSRDLVQPRINLALRLQAILLHGVCIIYRQQQAFLLGDVEALWRRVHDGTKQEKIDLPLVDIRIPRRRVTLPAPSKTSNFENDLPLFGMLPEIDLEDVWEMDGADEVAEFLAPITPAPPRRQLEIEQSRFNAAHAAPRMTMEDDMLDYYDPQPRQSHRNRSSLLEQHTAEELNLEASLLDEDGRLSFSLVLCEAKFFVFVFLKIFFDFPEFNFLSTLFQVKFHST